MWHNQEEWVTCRQCLISNYINNLYILNVPFWFKPHCNWMSGGRDMDNFGSSKNSLKHKNLSLLLAGNSEININDIWFVPLDLESISHDAWNTFLRSENDFWIAKGKGNISIKNCIKRACFQNRLHPLLHVTHLQFRS